MGFPVDHWPKIHSTHGLERLNGEVKRRTEVVGIFPNDEAITRLVGAILLEQNDEWAVQPARYMTLETMAALNYTTPRDTIHDVSGQTLRTHLIPAVTGYDRRGPIGASRLM